MREISHQIKGMKLSKAKSYIEDVIDFKQIVPFTVYTGGVGRHAQAKQRSVRSIRKED
jgi:large subunit ribosomal protein L17e